MFTIQWRKKRTESSNFDVRLIKGIKRLSIRLENSVLNILEHLLFCCDAK